MFTPGIVAAVTYAADTTGAPANQLTSMRADKLSLDMEFLTGVDTELQCLLYPTAYDPCLKIQAAPLLRYHKEVWWIGLGTASNQCPGDVLSMTDIRQAHEQAQEWFKKGQYYKAGPVGHALHAASLVNWKFVTPFDIEDQNGDPISLWAGTPTCLGDVYAKA